MVVRRRVSHAPVLITALAAFIRSQDIFDEKLVAGKELAPGFFAPEPEGMDHHLYSAHIERSLPEETPAMFGMPANAEIGYLTNAAEEIFAAFLRCPQAPTGSSFGQRCIPAPPLTPPLKEEKSTSRCPDFSMLNSSSFVKVYQIQVIRYSVV